ncbi:MAG TPA: hypothetical protein DGG94_03110 [Micromonosporaceae bacterium]|nr:hypothetical protein [Micromonosporaceae bacterium]HCU48805.1 hypothetical protein [Micromonosporaceae bacterium]
MLPRRPYWVKAAAFLAIAAVVAWTVWALRYRDFDYVDRILALSPLVGLMVAIITWARGKLQHGASPDADQVNRAAAILASHSRDQWMTQARSRDLLAPDSIATQWRTWERPVSVAPLTMPDSFFGLSELVASVRSSTLHRISILGARGAGKTSLAVLIALELVGNAKRGPIPVYFSLASWNPVAEPIRDWLERQLVAECPELRDETRFGANVAHQLIVGRRIFPVLDGLDEMMPAAAGAAIEEINNGWKFFYDSFILTSRESQYRRAISEAGRFVADIEIEARPVGLDVARAFLTENTTPLIASAWQQVLDEVSAGASPQIQSALELPLILSLARSSYRAEAQRLPTDLLDAVRFSTVDAIERNLLDRLLQDLYRPSVEPQAARRAWPTYRQASRWLSFLASHAHRNQMYAFGWWEVALSLRKPSRILAGSLCGAIWAAVAWYMLEFSRGLAAGFAIALFLGTLYGLARSILANAGSTLSTGTPTPPIHWWRNGRGLLFTITFAVMFGSIATAALGLVTRSGMNNVLAMSAQVAVGAFAGGLAGLLPWSPPPVSLPKVERFNSVEQTVRLERLLGIRNVGLLATVAIALVVVSSALGGLVLGVLLAATAIVAAHQPGQGDLGHAVSVAWISYLITLAMLAVSGRLPWHLQRFLADASRRGVLRRIGSMHQFRHASLQDHLCDGVRNQQGQADLG